MFFNPLPFRSEEMGLMMSQTASESLLTEPHTCLNVGFELSVGTAVAVGVGFAAALIATPLFQTSRVPDLMHVNFFPAIVEVAPAFGHALPALTAAMAAFPLTISVPITNGAKA